MCTENSSFFIMFGFSVAPFKHYCLHLFYDVGFLAVVICVELKFIGNISIAEVYFLMI